VVGAVAVLGAVLAWAAPAPAHAELVATETILTVRTTAGGPLRLVAAVPVH